MRQTLVDEKGHRRGNRLAAFVRVVWGLLVLAMIVAIARDWGSGWPVMAIAILTAGLLVFVAFKVTRGR